MLGGFLYYQHLEAILMLGLHFSINLEAILMLGLASAVSLVQLCSDIVILFGVLFVLLRSRI